MRGKKPFVRVTVRVFYFVGTVLSCYQMGTDVDSWDGGSPWLFFLGLVLFLGSLLLFIADLLRAISVFRSIAVNGVGVALLIVWAAHDTLNDPNSEVATAGGAAGTALLLYGLYLLAAGAVIALTGLVHDHMRLGFYYIGLAIVSVLLGAYIFPTEAVVDADTAEDEQTADSDDESTTATSEPTE